MIPGLVSLTVYKGAQYDELFVFTVPLTGVPLDISGREFTIQAKHAQTKEVIAEFVAEHVDANNDPLDTNVIRVTLDHEVTAELEIGVPAGWGIRDDLYNYYAQGKFYVAEMIPDA